MIEKAVLFGPNLGELAWEFMRFSPLVPYYYKKYHKQNVKLIIMTRPDRFDMYGQYADILVPLIIEDEQTKYMQDCFRLTGYSAQEYKSLVKRFNKKYRKRYDVLEHLYPKLENEQFAKKNQFPINKMIFKWKTRVENSNSIDSFIPNNKPLVVLAPRYRKGMKRNWPYWDRFYDLISSDEKLMNKYNFVICGKSPDYIPDKNDRFYDINKIEISDDISTVGLTIECIKRAILTVGSQSGIPNISMMMEKETMEWGNQKNLHTKVYNVKNTKIHFIDDMKYNLEPEIIFNNMKKILKDKK